MYPTSMCGKPHPTSFRTVVHSDRVCRLVFEPEAGNFWRCRGAGGNHLISDIVTAQPAGPIHAIFGGVPRPSRLGVLNSSPYAYQKAVSLVPAGTGQGRAFGAVGSLRRHQRGGGVPGMATGLGRF